MIRLSLKPLSPEVVVIALPFILCFYPAIALLAARSEIPVFFNLYSRDLFILNIAIVLSYALFLVALLFSWQGTQFTAILILCVLMLVATNNAVRNLPGLAATTQLVRLTAGFSLIVIVFLADKRRRHWWSGIGLGLGATVMLTALVDLSFSSAARFFPAEKQSQIYGKYRTAMDFSQVTEQDIVLVGDSFVWGAGVPVEQRFGDVLERKLSGRHGPHVYSLGIIGAGVDDYNRQILDIPPDKKARHAIVFFYANDMPPRVTFTDSIDRVCVAIGQRSITGRVLADLVKYMITPSPQVYAKMLLDSFAQGDATFEFRWKLLKNALTTLYQRTAARSRQRPTLIILPVLSDDAITSFDEPHRRVAELAEQIGFRAFDVTPTVRSLGQSSDFRAARNDMHLNQRGNAIIADILIEITKDAPARTGP